MSAATSATPQARRNASGPRPVGRDPLAGAAPMRSAPAFAFESDQEEFRVNIADIPRMSFCAENMSVDGLKPTLFSKLLGMFAKR